MTTANRRKILHRHLTAELNEQGFQQLGNKNLYYLINQDVVQYITFFKKSYGFVIGAYIYPLYIPGDSLHFEWGNTIQQFNLNNDALFCLDDKISDDQFLENIHHNMDYIRSTILPWLNVIGSPKGIQKWIMDQNSIGAFMHAVHVWRLQAILYTNIYLGDITHIHSYLDQFLRELTEHYLGDWRDEIMDNVKNLVRIAEHSPETAKTILVDTVHNIVNNFKL